MKTVKSGSAVRALTSTYATGGRAVVGDGRSGEEQTQQRGGYVKSAQHGDLLRSFARGSRPNVEAQPARRRVRVS
jgi:hypothetical protein